MNVKLNKLKMDINYIIAIKRHDSEEIEIEEFIDTWRAVRYLSGHLSGEYDFRMAHPDDGVLEYAEEYDEHIYEEDLVSVNKPKKHLVNVKEL